MPGALSLILAVSGGCYFSRRMRTENPLHERMRVGSLNSRDAPPPILTLCRCCAHWHSHCPTGGIKLVPSA
jgi:hypothetical protein